MKKTTKVAACVAALLLLNVSLVSSQQNRQGQWYHWNPSPCIIDLGDDTWTMGSTCEIPDPTGPCIIENYTCTRA